MTKLTSAQKSDLEKIIAEIVEYRAKSVRLLATWFAEVRGKDEVDVEEIALAIKSLREY